MQEGREIGERARGLFPDGVLVDERDMTKAAAETERLMADPKVTAIFEATFLAGDYATRVDVLLREPKGWAVTEVKSNLNLNDALIEDLAYTVNVVTHAGISVTRAELMLLSPDFRVGMSEEELFQTVDMSDEVSDLVVEFDRIWDVVPSYIHRRKPAEPQLIWDCRQCEFFDSDCLGKDVENHVFDLPRLSEPKFQTLVEAQITSIQDIPSDFDLTANQQRVRRAVITAKPVVNRSELKRRMASIEWPARYLDFETVKTAVPVFAGLKPHAALVTQYSVHYRQSRRHGCGHREYLADHEGDCRRHLAERLLADLGESGHILVYSSYEATTLKGLAKLFPDLNDKLAICIGRLFDLEKVIKACLYRREFFGRSSLKATLPVLTDLSYKDLVVQDGDAAVAKFARLIRGEVDDGDVPAVRSSLLEYCKRDTLAMVKLHDSLLRYCR